MRLFAIGVGLNLAIVVLEVIYGYVSHSLALTADAGHNLGDVLGLALAWGAAYLAKKPPSQRRTFGLRRTTIVASVANSLVLLFVTGGLAWESVRRLGDPGVTNGRVVIVVALIGMVVNGCTALLFMRGREKDTNVRAAFLHLASDALLSAGVAVSGIAVIFTGWTWIDPAVSLALAFSILAGTWSLMKTSMNLMLDAVPEGIDPEQLRAYLAGRPGVVEVHDLHIWAMSTTETALTAHLVIPGASCSPNFLNGICHELAEQFHIGHATLQIEPEEAPHPCSLASDHVV